MPRFFFHTADGGRQRDTHGMEFDDREKARVAAIRYTGDLLHDEPDVLWDGRDFRVEVTDEQQTLLFTIITLAVDSPAVEKIGARAVTPPEI